MARIVLNKQTKTIKVVNRRDNIRLKRQLSNITLRQTGRKGPQGDRGPSGLYVSPDTPPETDVLWVDTDDTNTFVALESVVAGDNITVDDTDPSNPIISATTSAVSGVTSVNTRTGDVTLTQDDVGLTNVDDTSDVDKPISSATQDALDLKVDKTITINGNTLDNNISLDTTNVGDSFDKRYMTEAERNNLSNQSGVNSGDQDISNLVTGPSSSADGYLAIYDGTTGKVVRQGSVQDDGFGMLFWPDSAGGILYSNGNLSVTSNGYFAFQDDTSSAVLSSDLDGNWTISHKLNGRDIAVDGAKLDSLGEIAYAENTSQITDTLVTATFGPLTGLSIVVPANTPDFWLEGWFSVQVTAAGAGAIYTSLAETTSGTAVYLENEGVTGSFTTGTWSKFPTMPHAAVRVSSSNTDRIFTLYGGQFRDTSSALAAVVRHHPTSKSVIRAYVA